MIEGLAEVGYTRFVVTPHADFRRWQYTEAQALAAFDALREAVARAGLPVELARGAEYTYGPQFHDDLVADRLTTLAGSRYILLELPEQFIPATMPQILFEIGTRGYYPVLAHPERCEPYQGDPARLVALAQGRALIQVSFRSLAGTFGRTIKKTAWRLVREGHADLVATDCHSPRELRKIVQPVIKALEKRLEPDDLDRLMRRKPARMLSEAR